MRVLFRVDAATWIGSGHVMRCLTLAKKLRTRGAEIHFICRDLPGQMGSVIEAEGFALHLLPADTSVTAMEFVPVPPPPRRGPGGGDKNNHHQLDHHPPTPSLKEGETKNRSESDRSAWLTLPAVADAQQTLAVIAPLGAVEWLIVDHYGIDQEWESVVRPHVKALMVIDDLANRHHQCDLLLDQNLLPDMERRYYALVPEHCRVLLGPRYTLLRDEFIAAAKERRLRDGTIKHLLLFMGGMDAANATEAAIRGLMMEHRQITVDVVTGAANPHRQQLAALCASDPRFTLLTQIDDMAKRLNDADLVIGAPGSSVWERAILGVPAIVVVLAENQRPIAEALQQRGAVITVTAAQIGAVVGELMAQPQRMAAISHAALAVMADHSDGVAEVAGIIWGTGSGVAH